ncbi:MAG: (2Fe-2S)-binding protein [Bacteroidota bacterium]|nr:(2Fe-2S)-binding protein [Bacteroidota bacterium]
MPDIVIENLNNIKLPANNNAKNVLEIIHSHFIDWMHACGGKGRCTTCKMQVISGMKNLSNLSKFEQQCFESEKLTENERLACQAKLLGDVVVRVPDNNKLPHMTYS